MPRSLSPPPPHSGPITEPPHSAPLNPPPLPHGSSSSLPTVRSLLPLLPILISTPAVSTLTGASPPFHLTPSGTEGSPPPPPLPRPHLYAHPMRPTPGVQHPGFLLILERSLPRFHGPFFRGRLNLETVDGSDPDPALLPDREQWPRPVKSVRPFSLPYRSPPAFKSSWERPRLMGSGRPWGGRNMGWQEHGVAEGPQLGDAD